MIEGIAIRRTEKVNVSGNSNALKRNGSCLTVGNVINDPMFTSCSDDMSMEFIKCFNQISTEMFTSKTMLYVQYVIASLRLNGIIMNRDTLRHQAKSAQIK